MPTSAGQLRVFSYLTAEKSELYRAIMRVFMSARQRFELHLRPAEVLSAVRQSGNAVENEDALAAALLQLATWGNLEAHPDTADVATVEDFYRQRFLYQITALGEAAERALEQFENTIARPGALQTAALADIRARLGEFESLAAALAPDPAKIHLVLKSLCARFEELTVEAQRFMNSLQRSIDLRARGVAAFVQYKQLLIHYLERFIGELVVAAAEIGECLRRIEAQRLEVVLRIAAERDLLDAFEPDAATADRAFEVWNGRWAGLRSWFLGRLDHPPQSEILRARARSACTALVAALAGLHDRRVQRSDRSADFRSLARWFAQTDSDADAHRLWRAAFALAPARHLFIDGETLEAREAEAEPATTSWLDARPVHITPRFRATGSHSKRGGQVSIIDRSEDKKRLVDSARDEARALEAARGRLATEQRIRLSEMPLLDAPGFELFLDLLGEALSAQGRIGETIETYSSDGSLRVTLEPTRDGRVASVRTTYGALTGPDHFVTIRHAADRERIEEAAE